MKNKTPPDTVETSKPLRVQSKLRDISGYLEKDKTSTSTVEIKQDPLRLRSKKQDPSRYGKKKNEKARQLPVRSNNQDSLLTAEWGLFWIGAFTDRRNPDHSGYCSKIKIPRVLSENWESSFYGHKIKAPPGMVKN